MGEDKVALGQRNGPVLSHEDLISHCKRFDLYSY